MLCLQKRQAYQSLAYVFLLAVQWIAQTLYVFIHKKLLWLCVNYLNFWFKRQKLVWTQYQVICVHACMHSSCDIRGRLYYFLYQLYLYIICSMLPCGFNFLNLYWSLCCDGKCFCLQRIEGFLPVKCNTVYVVRNNFSVYNRAVRWGTLK